MRKLILISLFSVFLIQYCLGQTIKVKIYLRDLCTDSITQLDMFELKKGHNRYHYASFVDSTLLILKDTGVYVLSSALIAGNPELKIWKYGFYTDTINASNIYNVFTIHQKPSFYGWICCGEKCEGYKTGYYFNGKKRIEGFFKKGHPVGTLIYYRIDGSIFYIENYNKRGRLKSRKDIEKRYHSFQRVGVCNKRKKMKL